MEQIIDTKLLLNNKHYSNYELITEINNTTKVNDMSLSVSNRNKTYNREMNMAVFIYPIPILGSLQLAILFKTISCIMKMKMGIWN